MNSPATPPPPSSTLFFTPTKPPQHHQHLKCNYQPTNKPRTKIIHNFTNKIKTQKIQTLTEFNNLFMNLVSANELDLAYKFYSNLPHYNLSPNNLTLSILINCYCKRNEPFEAQKVLQYMIDNGFRNPNVKTFTQVINSFCRKGRLSDAYKVFDKMRELRCEPTINTYNCLLKGLCYVGRVEEAYELLVRLKTGDTDGLRPDVYSFTAVMDGFCKVGRTDEALELLDEAVGMGLEPSIVSYNTVFNGYFKEGRPLEGFGLLERMKERGCVPDCVSYSTLLHGLLQWGEVRAGVRVCNEMLELGFEVDERMMNTLLRGLCRRSRKEKELLKDAYQLFDEMSKRDCGVDPCGLELVIEAFCNGNEVDLAFVNLCEMVKLGLSIRMFTLSIVVRGLCVEGKIEEAMSILVLVCRGRSEMFERVTFDVLINEMNRRGLVTHASCVYCVALKNGVIPLRKPR